MKANYKKKSFPPSDEIVSDMKFYPEKGKTAGVGKIEERDVFLYERAH